MTDITRLKEICEAAIAAENGPIDNEINTFRHKFPPAFCLKLLAVVEAAEESRLNPRGSRLWQTLAALEQEEG